jgi:acylpyruvate hydrolase
MYLLSFRAGGKIGVAASRDGKAYHGLLEGEAHHPGSLDALIRKTPAEHKAAVEALLGGSPIELAKVELLQPLERPGKIICVGLNYRDHASESGHKPPEYPTLFARFASSLVGPSDPIVRPIDSLQLDYEGELVAVIGKGGRRIRKAEALDHVAGYSIFNDGSVRDFQLRTPQWTLGKNFDGTGAFGPALVTADSLPPGARGLKIETRLNGQVMQSASTDDLIFDVATLVSDISAGITLEAGDLIVTGTPSGVGAARKPPVFMKAGDVCEVEIERIGILRSRVVDEAANVRPQAAAGR